MARKKFLQRVSLASARETVCRLARLTDVEDVGAEDSYGRIAAQPVTARMPSPHYRASAMDGIAVRARDTLAASAETPVTLREVTHDETDPAGPSCTPVDTGSPLPPWSDAVVRIEDTTLSGDEFAIAGPVQEGRDVRRIGEDIAAGALLFGRGHRIRPYDVGAMLAAGVRRISVRKPPLVAIFATGNEVVEPSAAPQPGQVIEFNSRILAAYLAEWGARAAYLGRLGDDPQLMRKAFTEAAAHHDAVCVIAGSSAGRKDFTVEVLASCGDLLVHGIDVMPGKPAAVACLGGTPFVGVPGYPVSATIVYLEIVAPLVAAMLGTGLPARPTVEARTRRKIASRLGVEEFVRVCLARDAAELIVAPLPRGAGSITTMVRADGFLRIAPNCEGIDSDTLVRVELLPGTFSPGDTLVVAGVPDAFSASLEDALRAHGAPVRFAHLGLADYDALVALKSGEAHMAVFSIGSADQRAALGDLLAADGNDTRCADVASEGSGARLAWRVLLSERFAASSHGSLVWKEIEARRA